MSDYRAKLRSRTKAQFVPCDSIASHRVQSHDELTKNKPRNVATISTSTSPVSSNEDVTMGSEDYSQAASSPKPAPAAPIPTDDHSHPPSNPGWWTDCYPPGLPTRPHVFEDYDCRPVFTNKTQDPLLPQDPWRAVEEWGVLIVGQSSGSSDVVDASADEET